MTETLFTYNPTLMSPRTKKYFEAMIREGNSFNYRRWRPSTAAMTGVNGPQKLLNIHCIDAHNHGRHLSL
jgi:hypothetical protein